MAQPLSLEDVLRRGETIQMDPVVLTQFEAVLGKRNVATRVADQIAYSHDIMPPAFKWVRRNDVPYLPHMILYPGSTEDVQEIVKICSYYGLPVIPAGGTSGTIAGMVPVSGGVIVDMKRMNRLIEFNEYSLLMTVEAGMLGGDYEDQCNMRGYIGGHYPQSLRCSTVGGWIAPRGVGTFSTKYGKIEDIVRSLKVVMADGSVVETVPVPRASCGPDLDQMFIGSEGTLGIITEATLRVWPKPEKSEWVGYGMPTFEAGIDACREILMQDLFPAVMRHYDALEASHAFKDLGYDDAVGKEAGLYFGCQGRSELVVLEVKVIHEACKAFGGVERPGFGKRWFSKRYDTTYLKNAYMLPNGIGDAIECSSNWHNLAAMHDEMRDRMYEAGADEVFGHGSHFYPTGGNLYMIWSATAGDDEKEIESLYWRVMDAAMEGILAVGGSIGHHHGIGVNKGPWMHRYQPTAWPVVQKIKDALDPKHIMNPGKMGL
jgi:alkyldihydroxyacetonephosphate synthase